MTVPIKTNFYIAFAVTFLTVLTCLSLRNGDVIFVVADNGEIGVPIRLIKGPDGSLNMIRVSLYLTDMIYH
jgi:hypothetical protein